MAELITTGDVERIVAQYIERARELGLGAVQAGAVVDANEIFDGAFAEARALVQKQPGGLEAWRDYKNEAAQRRRLARRAVAQGWGVSYPDAHLPFAERPHVTEYVLRYDDTGNHAGLERS